MIRDPLAKADFSLLPYHLVGSMRRYVLQGRVPGNFLVGCLANDLDMAFQYAPAGVDITQVLRFIKRYVPKKAYGEARRIAEWERDGGWEGWAPLFEYGEEART